MPCALHKTRWRHSPVADLALARVQLLYFIVKCSTRVGMTTLFFKSFLIRTGRETILCLFFWFRPRHWEVTWSNWPSTDWMAFSNLRISSRRDSCYGYQPPGINAYGDPKFTVPSSYRTRCKVDEDRKGFVYGKLWKGHLTWEKLIGSAHPRKRPKSRLRAWKRFPWVGNVKIEYRRAVLIQGTIIWKIGKHVCNVISKDIPLSSSATIEVQTVKNS